MIDRASSAARFSAEYRESRLAVAALLVVAF